MKSLKLRLLALALLAPATQMFAPLSEYVKIEREKENQNIIPKIDQDSEMLPLNATQGRKRLVVSAQGDGKEIVTIGVVTMNDEGLEEAMGDYKEVKVRTYDPLKDQNPETKTLSIPASFLDPETKKRHKTTVFRISVVRKNDLDEVDQWDYDLDFESLEFSEPVCAGMDGALIFNGTPKTTAICPNMYEEEHREIDQFSKNDLVEDHGHDHDGQEDDDSGGDWLTDTE